MHATPRARWCALAVALVVGGCKVADKQPAGPDGGVTGGGDAGSNGQGPGGVPDTRIDDGPGEFSNQPQVSFRFSSDDPAATFDCRIDKEAMQPCQSPYVRTLPDGSHSFSVRASDPSGKSDGTPAERVWTIDTVAPETTIVTAPPVADNTVKPSFEFTSSEDNVSFDCSIDGGGFSGCDSGIVVGPLGDGQHVFLVRARDRAGNIDPVPAQYGWTIDTRLPDTQILSGPPAASPSTSATFDFFSPNPGPNPTYQCSLDGAGFTDCGPPMTYGGLAERAHTFMVRVRNGTGNTDPTPATRTWTVDLTPPETTISDGPTGTVALASASIAFTSNEAGSTFACSLDGAPLTPCTSPATLTGLAQGNHAFAVRATDAAGHDDPSPATRSWTVDTVAPDISVTGPATGDTTGPRVVFGFTVSDGTVACILDGAQLSACTSPLAVSLPAGAHSFKVSATDAVNNTATATRNFTVMCSAPDPAGAAGLLHLDDTGQTLANAVPGGAAATLGDTADAEPGDPTPLAAGRFGGGLTFTAAESDHVAWPVALPAAPELAIELWANPVASGGARDLLVSADGHVALRVATAGAAVQFSATVTDAGGQGATATSASVAAGAWHHVLASLQGGTLHLWVDGARTDAAGAPGGAPALDALRLGGDAASAYDGALDEVWLSQAAIAGDDAALARYCPL
jgi:hypothetical protein